MQRELTEALGALGASQAPTLAPFAQAASLKLFGEHPSGRERLGMALIVVAAAMLIGR